MSRAGVSQAQLAQSVRANRAVRNFNQMIPTLNAVARMMTGNRKVKIVAGAGAARTNGTTISYRPPIELGDELKHDRSLCGQRDDYWLPLCGACRVKEDVYANIYHEISHIAFESFVPVTEHDRFMITAEVVRSSGDEFSKKIAARLDSIKNFDTWLEMAAAISPFLSVIVNSLEDGRINQAMFRARPGIRVMFIATEYEIFNSGVTQPDGTQIMWKDAVLNSQAMIGLYCLSMGYEEMIPDIFDEKIVSLLGDSTLRAIALETSEADSMKQIFGLAYSALIRLRELGYCVDPSDPEPEPEEEPAPGEEPAPEPQFEKQESDNQEEEKDGEPDGVSESEGPEDQEPDSSEPDGDSGMEQPEGGELGPGEDGNGDERDDTDKDGSSGAPREEDFDGEDSSVGSPEQAEVPEDDSPDDNPEPGESDSSSESLEESASSGGDGSEPEDSQQDSPGGEPSDASVSASSAGGNSPVDPDGETGGDAVPGQSSVAAPDSVDQDGGLGDPDETPLDQAGSGEPRYEDGLEEDRGDLGGDQSSESVVEELAELAPDPTPEEMGTAGQVNDLLDTLCKHGQPIDARHATYEDEAVDRAVQLMGWFAGPAMGISGVRIVKQGQRSSAISRNEDPPEMTESDIAPSLMLVRKVFQDNGVGGKEVNQKNGRVDSRVLGRRGWSGDDKLFSKARLPSEKSYFVVVGIDCSGSQLEPIGHSGKTSMQLTLECARAQCELLNRVGVPFVVYAHSTGRHDYMNRTFELLLHEVKGEKEPWNDVTRRKLGGVKPQAGNLDGHTLEMYLKIASRSNADEKIVLYYTDGAMPAANFDNELEVLQANTALAKKRAGTTLMAVGVRTNSPEKFGFDTVRVDQASDVKLVVKQLERKLSK